MESKIHSLIDRIESERYTNEEDTEEQKLQASISITDCTEETSRERERESERESDVWEREMEMKCREIWREFKFNSRGRLEMKLK
jgi:hypothetical protein